MAVSLPFLDQVAVALWLKQIMAALTGHTQVPNDPRGQRGYVDLPRRVAFEPAVFPVGVRMNRAWKNDLAAIAAKVDVLAERPGGIAQWAIVL